MAFDPRAPIFANKYYDSFYESLKMQSPGQQPLKDLQTLYWSPQSIVRNVMNERYKWHISIGPSFHCPTRTGKKHMSPDFK